MKLKVLTVIVCVLILNFACIPDMASSSDEHVSGNYLKIYYFHGNVRCASCHKIENYTKETITKYFDQEVSSGDLVYEAVNIDETGNAHFIEEYQLYTKSVVLSLVKDSQETRNKNLVKVWEYLGNKTKFEEYEKEEINKFLEEL